MRNYFCIAPLGACLLLLLLLLAAHGTESYPEHSKHYHYPAPRSTQLHEATGSHYSSHHNRNTRYQPNVVAREFSSPTLEKAAFTMALARQANAFTKDSHIQHNSQNVKLPVPLGISPISYAPLPLQAGAPYSTVHGLTSYGTPYPQRRRR